MPEDPEAIESRCCDSAGLKLPSSGDEGDAPGKRGDSGDCGNDDMVELSQASEYYLGELEAATGRTAESA